MFSFLRSLTSGTGAATLPLAAVLTAAVTTAQTQTQTFIPTGHLQTFTVPAGVTLLFVQAKGGKGGDGPGTSGGLGARVTGTVPCTPGATLQILVGRNGQTPGVISGGGGGGGTFLAFGTSGFADFATPTLVAGGGGGGGYSSTASAGQAGGTQLGGNGNGGSSAAGAGGGGILTNGAQSAQGGGAGQRAIAGGAGGNSHFLTIGGDGGFGGGGGSGGPEGAGGGGYSGGRGGNNDSGGRGGTSYADAAVIGFVNTPGGNPSDSGSVTLSWGNVITFSATSTMDTFVVPPGVVAMTLTAEGGAGGSSTAGSGAGGGRIAGIVSLPVGTTLQILVGKKGFNGGQVGEGGGGGGGTFVAVGTAGAADFATPLLVAGGGGGCNDALGDTAPGVGGALLGGTGLGGNAFNYGGGGGGCLGDGTNAAVAGSGGLAASNGGTGGAGAQGAGSGGFGGGGGGGAGRSGGGGGYTGGRGAQTGASALGGRSFASASCTQVVNTPGVNATGAGSLTIVLHFSMATVANAGAGCPSSGGSNTLVASSLPWIDSTFSIRGSGLPSLALVAVVTGFTPTALPLPLVFAQGQPGCNLLVSPDLVDVLFATGTATAQLVLPNTQALVGASFYQQMVPLEVDPLLNVLAVTATNALQMTVGY